ncbi:hypothetical protein TNCV_611571 [Trichonephila clavipes]|nr:hypothetical protein TNCV_611571 [Trichonephila clavipes]
MPLRRNRRQYEQLTDFDRGRIMASEAQVGRMNVSAATSIGRYGSCSVLATVDQKVECTVAEGVGTHPVPSRETIRETTDRSWLEEPTSAKTLTTDPTS